MTSTAINTEVTKKNKTVPAFKELGLDGENTVTAVRSVTGAGSEVRAAPPGAQRGHCRLRSRQESNMTGPQRGAWPDLDWGMKARDRRGRCGRRRGTISGSCPGSWVVPSMSRKTKKNRL